MPRAAAALRVRRPRPAAGGFTLVELMVVLALIGLMGAAVALTLPPSTPAHAADAEALAAALTRARQEAILTTRAVEASVDAHGYAFAIQDFGGWRPLDGALRARAWSPGVRPRLPQRQSRQVLQFDPTGSAEPATVALESGRGRARIAVDIAGEVSVDVAR